jgi:hypothetical protein
MVTEVQQQEGLDQELRQQMLVGLRAEAERIIREEVGDAAFGRTSEATFRRATSGWSAAGWSELCWRKGSCCPRRY